MRLTVREGGVRPRRAQVDAFLGIRLAIRNASRREQRVSVRGAQRTLELGPGARATLDLEGLRPGRYRIRAAPAGRATLVVRRTTP